MLISYWVISNYCPDEDADLGHGDVAIVHTVTSGEAYSRAMLCASMAQSFHPSECLWIVPGTLTD